MGAIALAASLKLAEEVGAARIEKRIYELTDHLMNGLRTIGVEVVTPAEREHRAGIVTFSAGSPAENRRVMEKLLEQKILVSVRYTSGVGGVRVSCHYFNNVADLDRLLNAVEAAVPRGILARPGASTSPF
ncbi:MAG: aminotransferase class V-fold PLP-dependent enzyme [Acidobacteria bacterium]|nr:aminotransferase class V-fold PLP-dependent enzyme [Acidobacteriota bacterium]